MDVPNPQMRIRYQFDVPNPQMRKNNDLGTNENFLKKTQKWCEKEGTDIPKERKTRWRKGQTLPKDTLYNRRMWLATHLNYSEVNQNAGGRHKKKVRRRNKKCKKYQKP